jgi:hypothetical protein
VCPPFTEDARIDLRLLADLRRHQLAVHVASRR